MFLLSNPVYFMFKVLGAALELTLGYTIQRDTIEGWHVKPMQQASANCADNHKSGISWFLNTLTSQFKQPWVGSNLLNLAEIVSSWAQGNNAVNGVSPPKCSTYWKKEKTLLKTCHPLPLTPSNGGGGGRYNSSISLLVRALNWDVKCHVLNTQLLQSREVA